MSVRFLFLFIALTSPLPLFAGVFINEIMYDLEGADSGREWVEVYNDGAETVDLALWKLVEANTNHALVADGAGTLSGGAYAVIADNVEKFRADYPSYSGVLFDSSFSLSNTGEVLALKDENGVVRDSVNYSSEEGAMGDGRSLQKTVSGWIAAIPTPGALNETVESVPKENAGGGNEEEGNSGDSTSPSQNTQNNSSQATNTLDIKVSAGSDRVVSVGADTIFEGSAIGANGKPILNARYIWNFGDGMIAEGKRILHTFIYPGEYVVVLIVSNTGSDVARSDSARISAKEASVEIAGISSERITLRNTGAHEIDLSRWILKDGTGAFVLPEHTRILPKGELVLANTVTGLSGSGEVVLAYPNGSLIEAFATDDSENKNFVKTGGEKTPAPPLAVRANDTLKILTPSQTSVAVLAQKDDNKEEVLEERNEIVSVIDEDAESSSQEKDRGLLVWFLALLAVVGIAVSAVLFIKKEERMGDTEELSADDFKIIDGEKE